MLTPSRLLPLLILFALLLPTGCQTTGDAMPDASVLMAADLAFAAEVAEGGSAAWAAWLTEDGAMVQPGLGEVRGRPAIQGVMAVLDQPGVTFTWKPDRAQTASSGDLGWTTGPYVITVPRPRDAPMRSEGRYVSIWRVDTDGEWRVVMNLGNSTDAPGAPVP